MSWTWPAVVVALVAACVDRPAKAPPATERATADEAKPLPHARPAPQPPRRSSSSLIEFVSERDGSRDRWIVRPGEEPRRLGGLGVGFVWAPDATAVAYPRDPDVSALVVRELESGEETIIESIQSQPRLRPKAWSPDGTLIAAQGLTRDGPAESGLVVLRPDGTDRRVVSRDGDHPYATAWSPDSRLLVYAALPRRDSGARRSPLVVVDLAGEAKVVSSSDGMVRALSWSPGADRIAYLCGDSTCVLDVSTGQEAAAPRRSSRAPIWSPDGRTLVFQQCDEVEYPSQCKDPELWLTSGSFDDGVRIAERATFTDQPWSPDGAQLVYAIRGRASREVWIVEADGSARRRLVDGDASHPSWSSNGIVFERRASPDELPDIYTVRPDGSDFLRVTTDPSNDALPTWRP